jgi:voltage-gated potassium channel
MPGAGNRSHAARRKKKPMARKTPKPAVTETKLLVRRNSMICTIQNSSPSPTRVRRQKAECEKLVNDVMEPFGGASQKTHQMPMPGKDGKVTTRMLLEAINAVQNSQVEFRAMVRQSIQTLAIKVDANEEEDLSDEEELSDIQESGPTLGEDPLGEGTTTQSEGSGKTISKALQEHEAAMDQAIRKMALKMFQMLDSDENNEISIDDAVDFVRKSGNSAITPTNESVSSMYDVDGNGKIDLQEFTVIVTDIYTKKTVDAKLKAAARGGKMSTDNQTMTDVFSFLSDIDAGSNESEQIDEDESWNDSKNGKKYYFCHFVRAKEAIDPNSNIGFACTITTMFLVLYSAFLIPARMGFDSEDDAGPLTKLLDFISEFWFLWDIVINHYMGFEDPETGQLILDLKRIRSVYHKSWFYIDFLSSIPFETVALLVPSISSLSMLKILRLCKLFRLVKLLKLKALEDLEDSGVLSPTTIRLAKITFTFIFLVHIVSCAYWQIVMMSCVFCEEKVWSGPDSYDADCVNTIEFNQTGFSTPGFCPSVYRIYGPGSPEYITDAIAGYEATLADKYAYAFYWAILAMLGDNAEPETNSQLMFSCFMSMIGIVVFSTVIGSLSAVLSNLDSGAAAKQEQLDSVNAYLSFRRVNPTLKLRIRGFYKYLWDSGQSAHHQAMFEELPETLSLQLMLELKEELIVGVPMFHDAAAKTVLTLVKSLDSCIAIPGEPVLKQGEVGEKMFFVLRGQLEVCLYVPSLGREDRLNVLIQGSFFGEAALFGDNLNPATIRALKFTELEVLELDDVRQLILEDPGLRKAIKAEARKNFSMSAARRPRNLMGMKQDDTHSSIANKVARDLRKKYGTGFDRTYDNEGNKKGSPVELLAEMQDIFHRDVRGLAPIDASPSSKTKGRPREDENDT